MAKLRGKRDFLAVISRREILDMRATRLALINRIKKGEGR
jgi:hypothetical protein